MKIERGRSGAAPAGSPKNHALVGPGSEPIPLTPGQVFSLGRSDDCSLTIPSKRVSRLHAEIVWESGLPVIKNVSTQNATQVNGRAVETHELRHRDEIQVGPYRCTYHCARGEIRPEEMGSEIETSIETEAVMKGTLSSMDVPALLRTFERQMSTGTLSLRQAGESEGQIVVDHGGIESAAVGAHSGLKAIEALLGWTEGEFEFSLEKKQAKMQLIRKFDYASGGGARGSAEVDLKRVMISDLLDWYETNRRNPPRMRRRPPRPPRGGAGR